MPEDPIRPGDWVVWSDYRDPHSGAVRYALGDGPFQVADINYFGSGVIVLVNTYGAWHAPRFRKDAFITAVKEALKSDG